MQKRLAQPAVNPGLIEKIKHLVVAPRQCKAGPVQDVIGGRGQRKRGEIVDLAVQRQGHAVGVACAVRLGQLADLHASPVIRPFHEGSRRVKAQKRDGQPHAVQHRQRLKQRQGALRLHYLRLAAVAPRQRIAAVD